MKEFRTEIASVLWFISKKSSVGYSGTLITEIHNEIQFPLFLTLIPCANSAHRHQGKARFLVAKAIAEVIRKDEHRDRRHWQLLRQTTLFPPPPFPLFCALVAAILLSCKQDSHLPLFLIYLYPLSFVRMRTYKHWREHRVSVYILLQLGIVVRDRY